MTLNDPLANVLSQILSYEEKGRKEVTLNHNSKVIRNVLKLMNERNYIGTFEEIQEGRKLKLNLLGNINKCGVIKPRYNVKLSDYVRFEKRYLPASGFGMLIVSTSKGIMTQDDATKKMLGGKLIAYIY